MYIPHWSFIYNIVSHCPDNPDYEEVQYYREFLESLQYIIPSHTYRQYYTHYWQTNPIDRYLVDNQLLLWVSGLHPNIESPPKIPMDKILLELCRYVTTVCVFYPKYPSFQEILYFKRFFLALENVIPSKKFRKLYTIGLNTYPIDYHTDNRNKMVMWVQHLCKSILGEI